jgi:hypothetical protein
MRHPLYPQKLALKLSKKWRSLGRYSSLADLMPRRFFSSFLHYSAQLLIEPKGNRRESHEARKYIMRTECRMTVEAGTYSNQALYYNAKHILCRVCSKIFDAAWRFVYCIAQLDSGQLSFTVRPMRNKCPVKNSVFWVVTPCGSCKNRRFGGTWLLLHQVDKNRCTRNNTSCN